MISRSTLSSVAGVGRAPQQLGEHAQARERTSDFVRDGRQQLALIVQLALDAPSHVVHGVGEHAHLAQVVPAEAHAADQVARANLARHADQIRERTNQLARQRARGGPQAEARGGDRQHEGEPRHAAPLVDAHLERAEAERRAEWAP